jgi:Flp pilus assembly protein TadD
MDELERFRTAQRLVSSGDAHSAIQVLEPLLDDDAPSSVLLLAARAAFATAQLARAEDLFRRLVDRDPADHYAHAALGRTLGRRSRHHEAVRHLRLATALDPEPWYAEALAYSEAAVGRTG